MTSVNAQLLSDTIYCDEMEFTYTSRAPNITATFAVIWGQSKPLDNPDNIHVLIYRCKEMANNCGMCLSLDEKYQCGWCQVSLPNFIFCHLHLVGSRSVSAKSQFGANTTFLPKSCLPQSFEKMSFYRFEAVRLHIQWLLQNVVTDSFGQKSVQIG